MIISDTLTPKLKQVSKRLETTPNKFVERMLRFAKGKARYYARGAGGNNRTGELERGIDYTVFKKNSSGTLFSYASNKSTGFDYDSWVNKDIKIRGSHKYFKQGQGLIEYGQSGILSPSGKAINWKVFAKRGYFTQAMLDTEIAFRKQNSKLVRRILK